jgi:uncharacterized protein with PhoU and TrkA domain
MEEVTLQAVKRAMPGHGRARIHSSLLDPLGISDNEEVEVVTTSGSSLTLTAFADSLVETTQIRISEEDLKKLGIESGTSVTVRRKTPLVEQVKAAAHDISEKATKGAHDISETVSAKTAALKEEIAPIGEKISEAGRDTANKISEGIAPISEKISEAGRDTANKISEGIAPISEKISEAGRETAARISDMVPTARFNAAVETGIKRLNPGDAADLKKLLLNNEGDIRAVTVTAKTAAGRTIQNLTLPPDAIIAAIQRVDNTLVIPVPDTMLMSGDTAYLIGKESALNYLEGLLEG